MGLRGPDGSNQDNYTLKNTRLLYALSLIQPGTRAPVMKYLIVFGATTRNKQGIQDPRFRTGSEPYQYRLPFGNFSLHEISVDWYWKSGYISGAECDKVLNSTWL